MLLRIVVSFYVLSFFAALMGTGQAAAEIPSASIAVNLPSRTIEVLSGERLVKEYPIAIGKPATPTPLGNFTIEYREINPAWYPPEQKGVVVPSGPNNPLGYRWLGFWNTYGIHGTNAPWSIGSAVSNGCIRMYEEDVEELYDMVKDGTPVRVTYDRVKVRQDANGQVLLSVYPDIYGYGNITIADIRKRLTAFRINALIGDEFLQKLLNEPGDRQIALASQFKISVNGALLGESGLLVRNVQYIPVLAVAQALKQKIVWDDKTRTVCYGAASVPGIVSNGVVYVSLADASQIFIAEQNWKAAENRLAFSTLAAFLNEKPIYLEINKLQGILAVSVWSLTDALERKVTWNEATQTLTLLDKGKSVKVPVGVIGKNPYIKITDINQYFDVYVYWNEEAKTLELTS